jgi:hypothetical protein
MGGLTPHIECLGDLPVGIGQQRKLEVHHLGPASVVLRRVV